MAHLPKAARLGLGLLTACALAGAGMSAALSARAAGSADLSLSTAVAGTLVVGQNLTYTLTATNNGPDDALQVAISLDPPTGSNIRSESGPGLCFQLKPPPFAACQIGTLAAGASATMTVVVTIGIPGANVSQANVFSNGTDDPNFLNNTSDVTTQIASQPTDIQVTGSASTGSPARGAGFSYTFQVKDNGPFGADGVTFSDALPASLALVSVDTNFPCTITSNNVICNLQGLTTGAQDTVTINATAPTSPATIVNTATVTSNVTDTQPANNSVGVTVQVK